MITVSVFDPRDARGDLGELKHLAHAPVMTEHGLADACLRESEEGELVVLVEFGVAPSAGAMALFAMALKDERRAHFMLRAPSFAEDFAKDFDEATEGVHKITLVLPYPPDPEIEIAVEAIPWGFRSPSRNRTSNSCSVEAVSPSASGSNAWSRWTTWS